MATGLFQVFSLILDSSVGLSADIQSAGDSVPETQVRILHSTEEDKLTPFVSKLACLCQSIEINNSKHVSTFFRLKQFCRYSVITLRHFDIIRLDTERLLVRTQHVCWLQMLCHRNKFQATRHHQFSRLSMATTGVRVSFYRCGFTWSPTWNDTFSASTIPIVSLNKHHFPFREAVSRAQLVYYIYNLRSIHYMSQPFYK